MQLNWPEPNEFPTLSAGGVHVWAVPLEAARETAAELESVLSPEERARADGFAIAKPRRVYVASRSALRSLLGRYLGESPRDVVIDVDSNGKPRLAGGELRFNLAHSGDLTLIALTSGCEIGVDVEVLRPVDRSLEIAARHFHPAELALLRAANATEAPEVFLRCWTRKEAVLKAIGLGMAYPLGEFDVLAASRLELPPARSGTTQCYLRDLYPCDGYAAAIATLRPCGLVVEFAYAGGLSDEQVN